jgi:hypothetical protein
MPTRSKRSCAKKCKLWPDDRAQIAGVDKLRHFFKRRCLGLAEDECTRHAVFRRKLGRWLADDGDEHAAVHQDVPLLPLCITAHSVEHHVVAI